MEAPFFIFAEAILKPRPGGKSIIDPNVQITAESLKQFNADPALVKQAVLQLKKAGFSIGTVGKVSISILATRDLFETIFGKKIIQTEVGIVWEGGSDYGFLDAGNTDFAGVLSGVSIEQGASENSSCEDYIKNGTQFCPDELIVKLGGNAEIMRMMRNIIKKPVVAIIDSGFDKKHPFFDKYKERGKVSVEITPSDVAFVQSLLLGAQEKSQKLKNILQNIPDIIKELNNLLFPEKIETAKINLEKLIGSEPDLKWLKIQYDEAIIQGITNDSIKQLERVLNSSIATYKSTLESLNKVNDQAGLYLDRESDTADHGTGVLSNFIPIASDLDITMIKSLSMNKPDAYVDLVPKETMPIIGCLNDAISSKPDIISCSFGSKIPKVVLESTTTAIYVNKTYGPYIYKIKEAVNNKTIILFASGNLDKKGGIDVEANIKEIIAVGGAYKDSTSKVIASGFAHGYMSKLFGGARIVPDICGWCGPVITDQNTQFNIWIPVVKGYKYSLVQGTSLATPQVAAVCALIKQVYPGATPDMVKKILQLSANEIVEGVSPQGFDFTLGENVVEIDNVIIDSKKVGLVNIKAAVELATKLCAQATSEITN